MEAREFMKDQFNALRGEIRARQMRMFWIVAIGLIGIPTLTYFAYDPDKVVWSVVPYFVLVLIVAFLAEQNAMMRAGRYIREHIENHVDGSPGWETWLESQPEFRLMEKHFFACFILVFFAYYFVSIGMAVHRLWGRVATDPSGQSSYWLVGAIATYAIGGVWGLATLLQHWKSSVSTMTVEGAHKE